MGKFKKAFKDFEKELENVDWGGVLDDETPPEITIEMMNDSAPLGGLLKGTVIVTGAKGSVSINKIAVELVQDAKGDEDDIGRVEFPYMGCLLEEGAKIQESFEVQNQAEYAKPSSKKVTHKLRVTVDCAETDAVEERDINIQEERYEYADEEFNEHYYIREQQEFLDSSVRGELRMFGFESGFVISWNDRITVRNNGGSVRWRKHGTGRTLAVDPDGSKLIASGDNQMVTVFDLADGTLLSEHDMGEYVDHLLWLDDDSGIIAAAGENDLYKLDTSGKVAKKLKSGKIEWISSLAQVPGEHKIYVADTNASQIWVVDIDKEKAKSKAETYVNTELSVSPDNTFLGVSDRNGIELYDISDFDKVLETELPGKSGVRYYGQDPGSCRAWEMKLRWDAEGNRFLINVLDGQVWLVNVVNRKTQAIPRNVVNWVEDTHWLTENTFAAIDSEGNFSIVDLEKMSVVLKEQDYAPD